jgi:hypothetical protein
MWVVLKYSRYDLPPMHVRFILLIGLQQDTADSNFDLNVICFDNTGIKYLLSYGSVWLLSD